MIDLPELQRSVLKLKNAQSKWASESVKERLLDIQKVKSLLERRKKEYSILISREMGKPIRFSEQEIEKCILLCDYCLKNADQALHNREIKTEGKSFVCYEPLGTVLIVAPWNYPFWLVLRPALQTLCAGNSVVVKHSSAVPRCAAALNKLFHDAGLESFAKVVSTKPENIAALIDKNLVDGVLVIGSPKTGSLIASKAAAKLKPHVLELGGSDPFIVFEDANLSEAVKEVVASRMLNSGQNCDSAKRLFVSDKIASAFEHALVEELNKITIGDPLSSETMMGPLVNEAACNSMQALIEDAQNKGARLAYGGHRLNRKGYYFMPTLLADTKKGMRVMDEEVFGPILPMARFRNEEEAVQMANDTSYGLGASIWTKDKARISRIIKKIQAGVVYVNRKVRSDIRMPFGGVKNSGYGRELGFEGFRAFTNVKSVVIR